MIEPSAQRQLGERDRSGRRKRKLYRRDFEPTAGKLRVIFERDRPIAGLGDRAHEAFPCPYLGYRERLSHEPAAHAGEHVLACA